MVLQIFFLFLKERCCYKICTEVQSDRRSPSPGRAISYHRMAPLMQHNRGHMVVFSAVREHGFLKLSLRNQIIFKHVFFPLSFKLPNLYGAFQQLMQWIGEQHCEFVVPVEPFVTFLI